MNTKRIFGSGLVAALMAAMLVVAMAHTRAEQATGGGAVQVDADDLGGVVTGPKGPEAGVWVIAETTDLPTKFVRIVVTDDRGRYLVPDLPKATLHGLGPRLWARGFGQGDGRSRQDAQPDGRHCAQSARPRRSTIPQATGSRCCRCRTRASSPAPGRAETESLRT